jgi:membrane protease YdiL (CAAX protease family)
MTHGTMPWPARESALVPVAHAFLAAIVVMLPSYPILWLLIDVLPPRPPPTLHPYVNALLLGVVSPVVETLLMVPLMWLAQRAVGHEGGAVVVSAVAWAVLHGAFRPVSAVFALWGFLVLGWVYVHWRRRRPAAVLWVVILAHVFVNLPAAVATVLSHHDVPGP